jgi:hypothetical protein
MRWMNWRFEPENMEPEISIDRLPQPCPSFIELKDDAFIRNPHLNADEADLAGIDRLLAMSPSERLCWNAAWQKFIRQCERQGWSPEMIAAIIWGDTRVDELH